MEYFTNSYKRRQGGTIGNQWNLIQEDDSFRWINCSIEPQYTSFCCIHTTLYLHEYAGLVPMSNKLALKDSIYSRI